jgi:D-alanyl-D-alanine carboxypeptidase/FG-GAP-like repeat/S-layer homology domain
MQPMSSMRRTGALLLSAAVLVTALPSLPARSSSDTSTRWDSFSEAASCGQPFTRTPYASRSGGLAPEEPVLGPFGTYFGRTVAQVRANLVPWTVPGSGGQMVWVHFRALPAFQRVASALAAQAQQGRVYRVRDVSAFFSRTIAGSHQMSRHGLGLAIDINPSQNPQRSDTRLITNMPQWFVDVWREAGFCWGGDWAFSKDPMHFSWMGPASGPEPPLNPFAPATGRRAYGAPSASYRTEFSSVVSRYRITIADVTGKGAPDVAGVRPHAGGSVIDVASGTWLYGQCSVNRWFVPDPALAQSDRVLFLDLDGDSGQDLLALRGGSPVQAIVATRDSDFEELTTISTGLDPASVALAGADYNGDRRADLWEARPSGGLRILGGPQFTTALRNANLPAGTPLFIASGDRDGGDRPELFALYPSGSGSRISVIDLQGDPTVEQNLDIGVPAARVRGLGAADYDGDGRADIQVLTDNGALNIHIGNTPTGAPVTRWFARPDQTCDDPVRLVFNGLFYDDEDNIFTSAIDRLGASGITHGCNPPFNDAFCPQDPVTRGQMAAFLVRALGYTEDGGGNQFTDDNASVFESAIDRLATAGVTRGCNPPANNRFCPDDPVTRGQMAAFLVRALGYTNDGGGNQFIDDNASVFESAIDRLATAGVTLGCNPPANTRFCPDQPVTRGQMAAFLTRALDL